MPKSTTLDDPEGPLRTVFQNTCVFGAHHENVNEDRPILSAEMMQDYDSGFRQCKVNADIRGVSLERGLQTTVGLSRSLSILRT